MDGVIGYPVQQPYCKAWCKGEEQTNADCLPQHPRLSMNEPPGDGSNQEHACKQMGNDGRKSNQNGTSQLKGKSLR